MAEYDGFKGLVQAGVQFRHGDDANFLASRNA
jgi:hypothetical protein